MVVAKSRDDLGNLHGETKRLRTTDVPINTLTHSVTQMPSVVYQIILA
jgi:hypothetical protein